ncbi:hypothetical protein D0861_08483 [Hortaea werneckii]|uniref:REJ domain-containing protein n=1 Tax=Hortaea werneckii TaxID=91943 RepID=A0A3M7EWG5_HORWE|nr:hypothetical protein D0861_08483 [Hortaea werneckii]
MQFFTFILAALMSVLAAAQNATVFDQSFCSGQPRVSGGYTYNSSNPFPISTLAQPTGGAATAVGTGGMAAPTGNATLASVTSASNPVADVITATATIVPIKRASSADSSSSSSSPNSTASIEPFTGAASSNRFEVVSALGGFGALAVVAALL